MLIARLFVLLFLAVPVLALKPVAADKEGTDGADEREPAEDTPRKSLTLGAHARREGEEAAADKGADAAAEGGERLRHAVKRTEAGMRRRRVGNLRVRC